MQFKQNDNTLTFSKVFKAPKALVFSMFQNPHVKKWWGPEAWPVKVSEQGFKAGGSWHYSMVGSDGAQAWGKALYQEIDEPNKIVFQEHFSDAEGKIDSSLPSSAITIILDEKNGKTSLTMRCEYGSPDAVKKVVEMGVIEGTEDSWNRLEKLLEQVQ